MSKIFQLEGGQYEHPNEYKLVSTIRGTTILQPEFGTVIIEGDVIEASTHNTIQKNGVLASKVNVTMESTDTVLVPTDMTIESDLFNELKIMLLFETGTTLPINSFIKLKDTNIPIANVNDYVVNANTPLLFLYFDSKFYAYKAGEGASTGAESLGDLSDVTLTSPTSGQALVYNGTKFVNQTSTGAESLGDLSDVTLTSPTSGQALVYNGTKFVNQTSTGAESLGDLSDVTLTSPTSGQALVYDGTKFVNLTQLATETKAGIVTEARIKEIAPQPDLTPYVPFSKGFRNQDSTDWFVRTNGRVTWGSDEFEMYNGDNNQFMGAFHTNGSRAYYKVPNRNGGNWNSLIDEYDLLDDRNRNRWKVIFDGAFGVQGGVVASLPDDWSDCLVYYRAYSTAGSEMNNSSMLITSSEKGGRYMVHYLGGGGAHAIKINVNAINQVVLADRYGNAFINKVLYKNNR